jgi:hypothetical protein
MKRSLTVFLAVLILGLISVLAVLRTPAVSTPDVGEINDVVRTAIALGEGTDAVALISNHII